MAEILDRIGRRVSYIRLSVTDRCDLRCRYCLPERPEFLPKADILTLEELLLIAERFIDLGVTKVRVTGGEPLMRRNLPWLLERIAALPGLRELVMTTNATRLAGQAADLRRLGVDRINISLDTLRPERFAFLTRNGDLAKVLAGIDDAAAAGFKGLRINTVLMADFNGDEIADLVGYASRQGADIAFIEEMPLGGLGREALDHQLDAVSALETLMRSFDLEEIDHSTGGPARYWLLNGGPTRVGFIAPHSRNFCADCNRVRISCTGGLYPCLGNHGMVALAEAARAGDRDELERLIRQALAGKPDGHRFDWSSEEGQVLRYMATTGG